MNITIIVATINTIGIIAWYACIACKIRRAEKSLLNCYDSLLRMDGRVTRLEYFNKHLMEEKNGK